MKWTTPGSKIYPFYSQLLSQTHLLIAGKTGSGKSVVINGIIFEALQRFPADVDGGAQLVLCDPKRVELSRYKGLPHVLQFAKTTGEIAGALSAAHCTMMKRFDDMERRGLLEYDGGDLYIIVDEFADLVVRGADREENKLKARCESYIESIGKLGRAARVHLILASQAPNRKTIKANIILNITAKMALQCESATESRQIIGEPGAENLPKYGDCLLKDPSGLTHYTKIPYIQPDEIAARVEWWMEQKAPKRAPRQGLFGFLKRACV